MVLVGLDPDMPVEIEPGILLAAKNVADLRALTAWPADLRLICPGDPRLPESVVTVELTSISRPSPEDAQRPSAHAR